RKSRRRSISVLRSWCSRYSIASSVSPAATSASAVARTLSMWTNRAAAAPMSSSATCSLVGSQQNSTGQVDFRRVATTAPHAGRGDRDRALAHTKRALAAAPTKPEKALLERRMRKIEEAVDGTPAEKSPFERK